MTEILKSSLKTETFLLKKISKFFNFSDCGSFEIFQEFLKNLKKLINLYYSYGDKKLSSWCLKLIKMALSIKKLNTYNLNKKQ